ncbi:late embryogenesis abundant protein 6-like [Actinidia eriantha]|uniref:late embryogenesis abundant protein 6-like n=1 Tax=Actinidia eriantha TaxID=165200 RepID=UPI0025861851|nr:late embryogenesis abundant protein 6-like [Actinidia eriantha]XP_057496680.1 late embryogenesis abundant protein 6-like [Actinidia eriantha]
MQAVKDKLSDMKEMRKVKAEAKAEEKAEKELAKARVDIAHEVRLARVAEGEMDIHVAKAGQRAEREIAKHASNQPPHFTDHPNVEPTDDPTHGQHPNYPGGPTTTANTAVAPPRNNFI